MFYFKLALALGMTVSDLLRRVTSSELSEWQAYYKIEPFGDWRADLRAGIVASNATNLAQSQDAKQMTPLDYMPIYKPEKKRGDDARLLRAQFAHLVKKEK